MTAIANNYIVQTKELQNAITPPMAVEMLKQGNKRFVENKRRAINLNEQQHHTGSGQYPFAAVLGCIDSRVPAELIFDQGIGDIFNVRIAGNFVNQDILGSLEFACKVAGAKAILVLGHTSCGAVKGACDDVKLGNLTEMLKNIKPAVKIISDENETSSLEKTEFVQLVAEKNVELTIKNIKDQSDILMEMYLNKEIAIIGGMYDVETGLVNFITR
ncbi:MAG: carbonic anhydrase family protein [Cyclobacteriaceae bacterium]|nr:carbonic anhydrase family protein [Cyclobacteriaceae bacterium]